ncbi:hypothetical protein ABFS82_05G106300 [Erythranthe guttata]|nr:PREDICTED: uncharacterized protein LOC105955100 [Erythranthe guttata]|eukprot:XP_012834253.1 PREDICTED: uncharacterized protein LOC105955100 [Erythranthe guttata]
MPATDNQGSFLNLISIRRNQLPSIETDQELEDLDLFQKHVAIRFSDILSSLSTTAPAANNASTAGSGDTPSSATADTDSPGAAAPAIDKYIPPPPPPFLSINWFRTLLDTFLCCEAEFKAVLVSGRDPSQFSKPPLDRLIPDLLERAVKALDVCNAVSHGVELVRHWQKLGQIAAAALQQTPIGEGQVRRARKALATLLTSMVLDDKDNPHGKSAAAAKDRRGSFRSLSWSVAKSWSAAKQIQAMSTNLAAPRGAESTGLAMPIYIMSIILVFVMWALVAGVPCQERNGLATHLPVPKQLGWAQPMGGLLEKMGEEWKKKEKKGSGTGLLEEIQRMEKVAQSLIDFADSFVFPLEEEKAAEMAVQVAELAEICRKMEEGLVPLQQQVREVFHRMVRSRAEVLEVLEQVSKSSVPVPY